MDCMSGSATWCWQYVAKAITAVKHMNKVSMTYQDGSALLIELVVNLLIQVSVDQLSHK